MFALRIRTLTGTHLGRCLKDLGIQNKLISSTACCHQDFSPGPQQPIIEGGMSSAVSARPLPLMTSRKLLFPNHYREPQQAWLESLGQMEDEKLGVVDLHPDVFGTMPRLDVLHYNVKWQQMYKKINYDNAPTRAEMRGGGRKPWPQKGTGRARHGSIRSPLWLKGGKAHGPRGPKSYFYMLTQDYRALGLRVALSTKYAQDNLHIVDSLDLPTDEPEYLQDLVESRNWGLSALFIDDTDLVSRNIAIASSGINHFNIMPVYGLNVHSMLKHECLVLTLAAVERIEERLLSFMHKLDRKPKSWKEQTTRL